MTVRTAGALAGAASCVAFILGALVATVVVVLAREEVRRARR